MSENTRAEVKRAAVHLFATLGFAGTGIRQLAREAGVTSSTLYHYMGTKDDLLFELMQESLSRLVAAGHAVCASTTQPEVVIARLVHLHVLSHALFQPETTVVDTELRALSAQLRTEIVQLRDQYETFWRDAIALGCRQLTFTVPDEQQARFALLEMCSGVASWYSPRGAEDLEHLAVTHAALALALLRADTDSPALADTALAHELMADIWGLTLTRKHRPEKERTSMTIRDATIADLAQIRALLSEHAVFEGAPDPDAIRHASLDSVLFGASAAAHVAIAEVPSQPSGSSDQPRIVAGLALWYTTFSSWEGTTGIWLEDLYLRPQFRRHGLGHQLMQYLRERTDGRIEWDVARANARAQSFYERLGARPVPDFIRMRWTLPTRADETA